MSRESVLARGRRAAEAGFVDTCTIRRSTGETTDDFSGDVVQTYDVVYSGKCRVKQLRHALPETHDVGQDYVILSRLQLQVPVDATGIQVGDEATIDTSAHDPDLPGTVLMIRSPAPGSEITARRFEVTERAG